MLVALLAPLSREKSIFKKEIQKPQYFLTVLVFERRTQIAMVITPKHSRTFSSLLQSFSKTEIIYRLDEQRVESTICGLVRAGLGNSRKRQSGGSSCSLASGFGREGRAVPAAAFRLKT